MNGELWSSVRDVKKDGFSMKTYNDQLIQTKAPPEVLSINFECLDYLK